MAFPDVIKSMITIDYASNFKQMGTLSVSTDWREMVQMIGVETDS